MFFYIFPSSPNFSALSDQTLSYQRFRMVAHGIVIKRPPVFERPNRPDPLVPMVSEIFELNGHLENDFLAV